MPLPVSQWMNTLKKATTPLPHFPVIKEPYKIRFPITCPSSTTQSSATLAFFFGRNSQKGRKTIFHSTFPRPSIHQEPNYILSHVEDRATTLRALVLSKGITWPMTFDLLWVLPTRYRVSRLYCGGAVPKN